MLAQLHKYNLKVNLEKCEFLQDKVVYCGQQIDKQGIHQTKDKIKAISVGAVLSHVFEDGIERPIAFTSRSFTKAKTIPR